MNFRKAARILIGTFFVSPYQKVSHYNPFEKGVQFVQKWRGHHPSVDRDAASVAYEEAQIIGTVCSFAFGGQIR